MIMMNEASYSETHSALLFEKIVHDGDKEGHINTFETGKYFMLRVLVVH